MKVEILPATLEHARELAVSMRRADVAEVRASGGYEPLDALLESLAFSDEARALLLDGEVAAIWGVGPSAPGRTLLGRSRVGVVWALTGSAVDAYPRAFLRVCRSELAAMLERYPVLVNAVDARYTAALRWVRWLGAEVREPVPFGVSDEPFHPVSFRSPYV